MDTSVGSTKRKIYCDITCNQSFRAITGVQRVLNELLDRLFRVGDFEVVLLRDPEGVGLKRGFREVSREAFSAHYRLSDAEMMSRDKDYMDTGRLVTVGDMAPGDIWLEIDITWNNALPRAELFCALRRAGVTICGYIYDVIPLTHPYNFEARLVIPFTKYFAAAAASADLIMTSAESTAALIRMLSAEAGVTPPPCAVVPLGADARKPAADGEIDAEVARYLARGRRYVLFVSTVEPRKNHRLLVNAYEQKLRRSGIDVVFVGRGGMELAEENIRCSSYYNKGIYWFRSCGDRALEALYSNAFAAAYPSYVEGFGLPVVESLQHGLPTVVSDVPVMHEVGGKYCDYVDPDDPTAFAAAVERYLDADVMKSRRLEIAGYEPLSWDGSCELLADGIRSCRALGRSPEEERRRFEALSSSLSRRTLREMADRVRDGVVMSYYFRPIASSNPLISWAVMPFKRMLRKLLLYMLLPLFEEINRNNSLLCSLSLLSAEELQEVERTQNDCGAKAENYESKREF